MTETSLDRKLARCAREIAESKPKGLSYAEFEAVAFPYPVFGAAQASNPAEKVGTTRPSPVATPPSKPVEQATPAAVFKVGDHVVPGYPGASWAKAVITRIEGGRFYANFGDPYEAWCRAEDLVLMSRALP